MTYKNGRDVYLEWRSEMLSPISIKIRLTHSLLCSPSPPSHGHTPTHLAISATAFTAVSLVISFLSLSTKMGKQLDSSLFNMSPRLAMTCPLKERHRASDHYPIQCNPKLPQRTPSQNVTRSASNATTHILSNLLFDS